MGTINPRKGPNVLRELITESRNGVQADLERLEVIEQKDLVVQVRPEWVLVHLFTCLVF